MSTAVEIKMASEHFNAHIEQLRASIDLFSPWRARTIQNTEEEEALLEAAGLPSRHAPYDFSFPTMEREIKGTLQAFFNMAPMKMPRGAGFMIRPTT